MSTRNRDAAIGAAQAARLRSSQRSPGNPSQMIGRRMLLDISEVTMVGFGELMDLHRDVAVSGELTLRALAGAIASLTLTMANGEDSKALGLLPVVFAELQTIAEERIRADHSNRGVTDVMGDQP